MQKKAFFNFFVIVAKSKRKISDLKAIAKSRSATLKLRVMVGFLNKGFGTFDSSVRFGSMS